MKRCGGDVVSVTGERRGVQKSETLQDTNRTLACYGDAVVLPHPDVGGSQLGCEVLAGPR
jgi:carbamoyl-phosphate synthase/aspartate carbamoyltransferase